MGVLLKEVSGCIRVFPPELLVKIRQSVKSLFAVKVVSNLKTGIVPLRAHVVSSFISLFPQEVIQVIMKRLSSPTVKILIHRGKFLIRITSHENWI